MKKLTILLGAFLLIFLAACGGDNASSTEESSDNSNETDKKVIRIGGVPDSFPTTYMEDGEITGFSAGMIMAIIEEAGYEYEWVVTDWNGVLANLQSGKVDTASNFAATEERGQDYNFTTPYYSSKASIATAKDNDEFQTLEDFSGKEVASIMGTNFENVLAENHPDLGHELVMYESTDVVYTDVSSGRIDGFLYGREQLLAQINIRDLPLRIVGEPFGNQPVAMPFKKTEENEEIIADLNAAIERLKEDGTLAEISKEYFGVDLTKESEEK